MRVCRLHCGLVLAMMLIAFAAFGQSSSLNPTVTVLPQATAPVPPECIDQPSQPIQRVQVEAPPTPAAVRTVEVASAATSDFRSELAAAHAAATARDRESFVAAHARARALVATVPAGRERAAATDALAALDDVSRLWDYQFNTPAGSFFDETVQNGSLLRSLAKYPGYEDFIRRHTIVDANGNRYYPTRESMDFVLRVASDRLTRIGIPVERRAESPRVVPPREETPRTTARTAPPTTTATRGPAQTPVTRRVDTPRQTTTRRATSRPSKAVDAPPRTTRRRAPPPASEGTPPSEEPPIPSGVVSTTSPPSERAAPTEAAAPTETAIARTDATATSTTETATSATETATATTATEGQSSAGGTAERPERRRSVILPLVLILIGVGVLIVLFRASS